MFEVDIALEGRVTHIVDCWYIFLLILMTISHNWMGDLFRGMIKT